MELGEKFTISKNTFNYLSKIKATDLSANSFYLCVRREAFAVYNFTDPYLNTRIKHSSNENSIEYSCTLVYKESIIAMGPVDFYVKVI